jgi:hypothetical protein
MNTRIGALGGVLGWQGWIEGTPYTNGAWIPWSLQSHFGLSGPNDWSNHGTRYGSIAIHQNISPMLAGPVLVCQPTDSSPRPPGPTAARGAAPVDGWYHLQFSARSGITPSCEFTIWMNTNDEDNPTSEPTLHPSGESLGVTGWGNGTSIGAYVDQPNPVNQSIIISAFEVADYFDPTWYPG